MSSFSRQPKHRCLKESCPCQSLGLRLARRRSECLPETLLQPRPQSLPV
jgi:hypothetical protein